ncbi:hypothetical protein [Streptomyces formicae]|uniref:Monooxygenase n=1 Tax=Streptomyces formicae TaxID=1616117 RepID=A0ABY3WEB4_9ACTN|nr:hypothetical protein J4032_04645 [Streptomyces formicae]
MSRSLAQGYDTPRSHSTSRNLPHAHGTQGAYTGRRRSPSGRSTQQLGIGYRGGPLSTGAAGALAAGDRAPDGRLPGGSRLFDVFRGPHFTLLAVGTDAELPPGLPGIVQVHRTGPYEPYGKGLFLVRPDGYVGWAGEDATGLVDHLDQVTG